MFLKQVNFWSNDHQYFTRFPKPKVIRPGDKLSTTCIFDTRKRPSAKFGLATKDEMCIDFLYYYPVQRRDPSDGARFECHAQLFRGANFTGTACGDPLKDVTFGLPSNPTFKDTVGRPDIFGKEPDQCVVAKGAPGGIPTAMPIPAKNGSGSEGTPGTGTSASEEPVPMDTSVPDASPAPNVAASVATPVANPFTPRPSPSPTASNADPVCFSGSAFVQTRRGVRRMRDLRIGDDVAVGGGQFSRVFMFTHRIKNGNFRFLELRTPSSRLALSAGHFIYADGQLKTAADVRLGDRLRLVDGSEERMVSWKWVDLDGLYNPQTLHGDIAVNGVVASTYTKAVPPSAAHALLAPFRVMQCGLPVLEGDGGAGARVLRSMAKWSLQLS